MDDIIDRKAEIERLTKEREAARTEYARAEAKLSNSAFVDKAPEKVVAAEREKLDKYAKIIEKLTAALEALE